MGEKECFEVSRFPGSDLIRCVLLLFCIDYCVSILDRTY